jgi:hypothetical protein
VSTRVVFRGLGNLCKELGVKVSVADMSVKH